MRRLLNWLFDVRTKVEKPTKVEEKEDTVITIAGLEYIKFDKNKFYLVLFDPVKVNTESVIAICSQTNNNNGNIIFVPVLTKVNEPLLTAFKSIEFETLTEVKLWLENIQLKQAQKHQPVPQI